MPKGIQKLPQSASLVGVVHDDARIEFCKFSGLSYDKYAKSWDVAEPEDFNDFIEAFAENFCIILDLQGFAIHWRIDNEEVAEPKPLARV